MSTATLTDRICGIAARCTGGDPLVTGDPGVVKLPWNACSELLNVLEGRVLPEDSRYAFLLRDGGRDLAILLDCPPVHVSLAAARWLVARDSDTLTGAFTSDGRPRYGSGGYLHSSRFVPHASMLIAKLAGEIETLAQNGPFGSNPTPATPLEATLATLLTDAAANYPSTVFSRSLASAALANPGLVRTAIALEH